MKKINLLDILGLTDNRMINQAIETDSAEKLKKLMILEKKKKHSIVFKYTTMFAGGFAVLIMGIFLFNNSMNNNVMVSNPMIEVTDIGELEKYINLKLSKYEIKKIKEMFKYSNESLIQINYTDDTILRISKGKNDNSGIYGAALIENKKINNIDVKIYEFADIKYAIWNDENYTYCYISIDNEDIYDILSRVV